MGWDTVIRLACLASGHSRYRFDRRLQADEQLATEAVARMQLEKLQALLAHAYATVPYYRELFEREKITPQDVRSLRDYAALPILTKAIIRERGTEAFRSSAFPPSRLADTTTSGSTGEPLRFLREHEYEEWRMAGSWRAWRWGGWAPGDKIAWVWREYWSQDRMTRLAKRLNWWITRRQLFDVHEMSGQTIDHWIEAFQQFRPKFVHGFPSAVAHFAKHLADRGARIRGIQAVFTNGEMLQSGQRELIEQAFNAKVHNVYGSSEVHPIAAECRQGGLHLSTDLLVPELVDGPPGTDMKRIVLTPLHAYGMPLLRYEVGDVALSTGDKCSCGLPFPVLEGLIGRAADVFPLPDGRVVHGQILIAHMNGIRSVERFQFRQSRKDLLHLYIVKGAVFDERSDEEVARVRDTISRECKIPVHVEYVAEIPRTSGGKFRYAVCEVNA